MAKKNNLKYYQISIKEIGKVCCENLYSLGIAETITDDNEREIVPVGLIKNSDEFIDLSTGKKEKTAYAVGLKQNLFRAVIGYKEGNFDFYTSRLKCSIPMDTIVENFGSASVKLRKI